ncbi:hypothetical protein GCM10022222_31780 [Amycolatopsis ultiminotia]|uniref:Uncharacterized protein n=2 Tax=Amycolatopsis ultiminotia TaxID=543629 RepID=A0ABP6W7G5_9PSEU
MPIPHARVGGHFELTDHLGERVTPERYRGPLCPAVLSRNSRALDLLGRDADEIRPLYITVDPDRDTPEVLAEYLRDRHPRYTGLTGTAEELAAGLTEEIERRRRNG